MAASTPERGHRVRFGARRRSPLCLPVNWTCEALEARTLFSGPAKSILTLPNIGTFIGSGNAFIDVSQVPESDIKGINNAAQAAAGAASIGSAVAPLNPGAHVVTLATNSVAVVTQLRVLNEDVYAAKPDAFKIAADLAGVTGNLAGITGAGLHLVSIVDPEPISRIEAVSLAEAFDAVGAASSVLGVALERVPTLLAASKQYLKGEVSAFSYATGDINGLPAASAFKAAANAEGAALNATQTAYNNFGKSAFVADAKTAARAINNAEGPINNWLKAQGVPSASDTETLAGNSSFTVSNKGGILLTGSVSMNVAGTTATTSVHGVILGKSVNKSETINPNNFTDNTTAGPTGQKVQLSVSARILPSGQASETLSGPQTTSELTGASINLGNGTGANVLGNGDTVTAGGAGDQLTLAGAGNTVNAPANGFNFTDSGTADSLNASGSNDRILLKGRIEKSTTTGTGDSVTGSGSGDSVTLSGPTEYSTATVSGVLLGASGSRDSLTAAAGEDTVSAGGPADSVTLQGAGDSGNLTGAGDTVISSGANDSIQLKGGVEVDVSTGAGDSVTGAGANDSITLNGPTEYSTATVSGVILHANGTNDSVTLKGDGETATETGSGDTATVPGSNDQVNLDGSKESAAATGANDTVYLQNSTDHATATGAGDKITGPGATTGGPNVASINLEAWASIGTFTTVGFRSNTVAVLNARDVKGNVPSSAAFSATISWGDGSSSPGSVAPDPNRTTGFEFVVLGSHVYSRRGSFPVTVTVTGTGGVKASHQTTTANVSDLGSPAGAPPALAGPRPLTYVTVNPEAASSLTAFQGVGFQNNVIGFLTGTYDGSSDTSASDYKVQVNWGDGAGWQNGIVAPDPSRASHYPLVLLGSHTYSSRGDYAILVNVTGPDGMTIATQTCSCAVLTLPSGMSGTTPPLSPGNKPPGYATLSLSGVSSLTAGAGQSTGDQPVGVFSGTYDGATDNSPGDYKAYVNFGDSNQWVTASVVSQQLDGYPLTVRASHTYAHRGSYSIVVYVIGPDGITLADQTCYASVIG